MSTKNEPSKKVMFSRILALITKGSIKIAVRLIQTELNLKFTDLSKVIAEFSSIIYYFHYNKHVLKHMYVNTKMMKGNFLLSFNPPDVITMTRNTKNQEKCLGNQQGNRTYYLLANSIVNKRFIFAD